MNNLEIAKLLRSVAAAYQVNPATSSEPTSHFRIVAYQNAADAIEHLTSEVKDLWDDDKLREIPGVGNTIADYLDELFKTGKIKHFEEIMHDLPPAMFELMDVPGIGAKRALRLSRELGITRAHGALEKLIHAAEHGHIRNLEGFGEQLEKEILLSVKTVKERSKRLLLPFATIVAEEVVEYMQKHPGVEKIETLGSLRRRTATVGDIDIAVATNKPKEVIEHFAAYPKKNKLIEKGDSTSSLLLPGGVQVDLMVQPAQYFGALLQHFTGSKHHNIALRTYALKKKLSLSERGIKSGGRIEYFENEEAFYKRLGMDWIPPELRENDGEIELALLHQLPKLVELEDIKGDLHMHSNFPQETSHDAGTNQMEDYANMAVGLNYEYIGFTEHNLKSSTSEAKVLDVLKQKQELAEKLNLKLKIENLKLCIFNGLEIDITPSGKLALPENAFTTLDYAIVSLHSSFRGTKADQTKRVLEGLAHPKVRIFGHPTGRKLNNREGVELDWDKIFDYALKHNKWIEINSSPDRLDLPDTLARQAVKLGVKLIVDTDSHEISWLSGMRYGISVARRGWAEKKDVVNTLSLQEFEKILHST
ncbi:MAG: DNA polymerase (family X) [Microgenomates group bacterium Gr01-1014_5]|nr:MAG: DNA polymerase (family X) [Microgenomates group bacterium Gr01-1014_5]